MEGGAVFVGCVRVDVLVHRLAEETLAYSAVHWRVVWERVCVVSGSLRRSAPA